MSTTRHPLASHSPLLCHGTIFISTILYILHNLQETPLGNIDQFTFKIQIGTSLQNNKTIMEWVKIN